MSALRTNYYIQSKSFKDHFFILNQIYFTQNKTSCNCRLQENQCTHPAHAFYNSTLAQFNSSDPFQVNKFNIN